MSPRKYKNPGPAAQKPENRGWFRGPNPDELAAYNKLKIEQEAIRRTNRQAAEARQMMRGLPEGMKNDKNILSLVIFTHF